MRTFAKGNMGLSVGLGRRMSDVLFGFGSVLMAASDTACALPTNELIVGLP